MTKRKSVVSKILLLVVLLTLVSCCFLGSTFARYTSGGRGSGSLTVAKWNVSIVGGGTSAETALDFKKLSPAKEAYVDSTRTHSTGRVEVATITNASDVKAEITFRVGDLEFKNNDSPVDYGDSGYSNEILRQVFTVKFYDVQSDGEALSLQEGSYTTTLNESDSITIYAEIIWTSDLGTDSQKRTDGDTRDTWIGQNVTKITCTFGYVANQSTVLPA